MVTILVSEPLDLAIFVVLDVIIDCEYCVHETRSVTKCKKI